MGVWLLRGACRAAFPVDSEVNGYRLQAGEDIVVPVGRSVLVRSEKPPGGTCKPVPVAGGVYESYLQAAEQLAGTGRRIMLVGPSDSGKTTLASFVASQLGSALYLTVDVGQNELYSPGFTAATRVEGLLVPGSGGASARRCFVGAFSPARAPLRYVSCARALSGPGAIIVDTDGWVELWEGLDSKAALARALDIGTIGVLGMPRELVEYLKRETGASVLALPRLVSNAVKSREERRVHRERLLARALQGAKKYSVSPDSAPVYGAPVFVGEPLEGEGLDLVSSLLGHRPLYAEKVQGKIVVVARRRVRPPPGMRVLVQGWEKGLIAASYPEEGEPCVGLVESIDYRRRRLRLLSPCKPTAVHVGLDRVSIEGFA
ncbi:MAG: hypothetical protein F7C34_00585 [Desulfurococcales archaeon]|nr:hypothetical protein [Desulfurococcales archaeon]